MISARSDGADVPCQARVPARLGCRDSTAQWMTSSRNSKSNINAWHSHDNMRFINDKISQMGMATNLVVLSSIPCGMTDTGEPDIMLILHKKSTESMSGCSFAVIGAAVVMNSATDCTY